MEKNTFNDNANYYIEKHKLLFINIPKVGSSTLWSLAAFLNSGYTAKRVEDIRKIQLPSIKTSELSNFPDVRKVAFVRNPFDRVFSTYRNKIVKADSEFLSEHKLDPTMSFEAFVDYVSSLKDWNADRHIRSQYTFLFDNLAMPIVDELGRLESIENDLRAIAAKYNLPVENIPTWHQEEQVNYQAYYNEYTKTKIQERYAIDLHLFGYKFESLDSVDKNWSDKLTDEISRQILVYKSQKLLRIVKQKEKYDELPKGIWGLIQRKYKEYFTDYFNENLDP